MPKSKPRPPVVVVEVYKGVAEPTLAVAGEGPPDVYILDWDNIYAGDPPPSAPAWVKKEYKKANKNDFGRRRM